MPKKSRKKKGSTPPHPRVGEKNPAPGEMENCDLPESENQSGKSPNFSVFDFLKTPKTSQNGTNTQTLSPSVLSVQQKILLNERRTSFSNEKFISERNKQELEKDKKRTANSPAEGENINGKLRLDSRDTASPNLIRSDNPTQAKDNGITIPTFQTPLLTSVQVDVHQSEGQENDLPPPPPDQHTNRCYN